MDITNNQTATGPVKFSQDEINELTALRGGYDEITLALGQLELQRREVQKREKILNERLISAENQEKVFLDKIVAKYGEGTFDINTGVFSPKKA